MKSSMWFGILACVMLAVTVSAEQLSLERQREIIEKYMYVSGQTPNRPAALTDMSTGQPYPDKCGTPAILDYQRNRGSFDRRLMASLGVEDEPRPVTQYEYGVPGGHTLIHYDVTGAHAVWQAGVDSDGDGVPDYVQAVAMAAESCYVHIIDTLGYPRPMVDSGCVDGGDARVDIFLQALPLGYYGMTYNQPGCYEPDVQHEAAWVILDHDFQHIPQYVGRPLDAARVTLAHELFHTVHFAIDATEHVTWFEMSSVWMEEEIYTSINDYYYFDYVFFDNPRAALQDTVIPGHMYQAVVWPIYLSTKYGRDIIKAVWLHAGALGLGPQYLQACNIVIDSSSQAPAHACYKCLCYNSAGNFCLDSVLIKEDFSSAMAEFSVWNFFTGPYASQAPDGIGYREAAHYSYIPLDSMDVRRSYPITVTFAQNRFEPAPNGVTYIRLENLQAIDLDTLLTSYMTPDPDAIVRWGITGIFQMENNPDSHVVVSKVVDSWETWICMGWDCVDSTCTQWDGPNCLNWQCIDSTCTDLRMFAGRYLESILGDQICTSGEFDTIFPCDTLSCTDTTGVIALRPYRSLTLALTPDSPNVGPFSFGSRVQFAYSVFSESAVDQSLVNLAPSVLTPYPNPAVINEMGGEDLNFRFRTRTDSIGFPVSNNVMLQLDIYTVAGELVRSLDQSYMGEDRFGPRPGGIYEIGWDMKNQAGKNVASGVYLAVARLFDVSNRRIQLAEDQVKVALIR